MPSSVLQLLLVFLESCFIVEALGADSYVRHDFPPEFVFGAGTSAYQVEGAANQDGRTPSIWDTSAHAGYWHGANGDIACDAYHKYKEDVQLMADLGLNAYRFSISWSRLIPHGRGPVNSKGLQYYNNLIDELIKHGMEPHVTLHHYDLPQALEDEYGGWVSRKIVRDFTEYADVCFRNFGDRVSHWTTVNEANVFIIGGYDIGFLPPNRCSKPFNCSIGNSSTEPYLAGHHILLAHAEVANLYRKKYQEKQRGSIGFNLFSYWSVPFSNSTEDVAATKRFNDFYVGWFLNPIVYGDYPGSMKIRAGSRIPTFTDLESKKIKGSSDFIGLNYYQPAHVKDDPDSMKRDDRDFSADMGAIPIFSDYDPSSYEFPIAPWGLKGLLKYIKKNYGDIPLYIHENGQRTKRNSSLEDWPRVKSLHAHIGAILDVIRDGVDIRGYFTWTLMDGFELLDGYKSAYGLFHVDLDDPELRRYPKLSAGWYSQFLNDMVLEEKDLTSPI